MEIKEVGNQLSDHPHIQGFVKRRARRQSGLGAIRHWREGGSGEGSKFKGRASVSSHGGAHLAPQSYPWNAVMRVGLQERPASWPRPPPPDPHWHTFLPGLHFDAHKENSNHLSVPSFNLLLQAWQKGHESNLTVLPSRSWGHSGSWKSMGCRTQEPWSHYASACISPFTFTSGLWGNRSQRPVGSSQEHRLWCGTP